MNHTYDERVLLAHKVFEKEKCIAEAAREINRAKLVHATAVKNYHQHVADTYGCEVEALQFSDSMVCFGTKLVSHCVWDVKENPRWPSCIFCGAPRDGE